MILDMIQGCRYSRKSTDRWTLSKNSTTRQRTQGFCVKPVCIENVSNVCYIHSGPIFIPCQAWLRMDLIRNLSLNAIAYPSIRLFRSGHVTTQSRKISTTVFLAERKRIADRGLFCRILLKKPSFCQTDSSPRWTHRSDCLPNFGVNICPFNYGIKVILLRNWLQPPTSWICSTPILSLRNPPESSSRSKP
jgi:hypothetical protein